MALRPVICSQGFLDKSGERSTIHYPLGAIDDALVGQVDLMGVRADLMHDAFAIITLCNLTDLSARIQTDQGSALAPVDVRAQREIALQFALTGELSGQNATLTVPGPDLDLYTQVNTDVVDPANPGIADLVTAIEANCQLHLTPSGTESVVVTRIRVIGRPS
jgi:hypothetical protein